MNMDLKEEEKKIICHALKAYLSDLRGEISKTEKHDMKVNLHEEKKIIENFIAEC